MMIVDSIIGRDMIYMIYGNLWFENHTHYYKMLIIIIQVRLGSCPSRPL